MTDLSEYLRAQGITQAAFAAQVGASQPSVYRWCAGRTPAPRNIRAIERATNGAVTAQSFFGEVAK